MIAVSRWMSQVSHPENGGEIETGTESEREMETVITHADTDLMIGESCSASRILVLL